MQVFNSFISSEKKFLNFNFKASSSFALCLRSLTTAHAHGPELMSATVALNLCHDNHPDNQALME